MWGPSLGLEDLLEEEGQCIPIFLPGESHGWRKLVGCSPWGCKRVGHDLANEQQLRTFNIQGNSVAFQHEPLHSSGVLCISKRLSPYFFSFNIQKTLILPLFLIVWEANSETLIDLQKVTQPVEGTGKSPPSRPPTFSPRTLRDVCHQGSCTSGFPDSA